MDIEHTSKISTLEVTVSQQAIQIKKLQERINELEYTDTGEVLIEANIDLGDKEMTNDERIQDTLEHCRKIAEKNRLIENLIEWELDGMGIDELASHYFNTKKELYKDNPRDLEDMLEYRKQYEDTEVVLYWDTDKKDVQPVTTRKPSWDISKAPIEFKNPNLDIEE